MVRQSKRRVERSAGRRHLAFTIRSLDARFVTAIEAVQRSYRLAHFSPVGMSKTQGKYSSPVEISHFKHPLVVEQYGRNVIGILRSSISVVPSLGAVNEPTAFARALAHSKKK